MTATGKKKVEGCPCQDERPCADGPGDRIIITNRMTFRPCRKHLHLYMEAGFASRPASRAKKLSAPTLLEQRDGLRKALKGVVESWMPLLAMRNEGLNAALAEAERVLREVGE